MRRLLAALGLLALVAPHVPAQTKPESNGSEKAIERRIQKLRSLPDDERTAETRRLAFDIRQAAPSPGKLSLATSLSGLSTEGDFGRDVLEAVAGTLSAAITEQRTGGAPAQQLEPAYAELARVVHYEGLPVPLNDPEFVAAVARLRADDEARASGDFTLQDLNGKSWTLKELRGSVVLVNFWATWCPPCRKEMPDLETLYRRFASQGLVILGISDEDRDKVKAFLGEHPVTYPVLLDPGRRVNQSLHIQGIPISLVYNRAGELVAQAADMRTLAQFLDMLERAGLR
jgi:peroxiredoxin